MSTQRPDASRPDGGPGPKPGGGPDGPSPSLRPTNPASLVVAALLTAALAWLLISRFYGDIPDLTWLPGLTLGALAVAEALLAHNTRARIERKPGAGAINALLIARYAVLAKASSLGGAIFAGAYGGVFAWALAERDRLRVASANLVPSVAGLVGALALVAAALLLERACRVPKPPDDSDSGNGATGGTAPRR